MKESDVAMMLFLGALLAWRPRPNVQAWVFPAPDGSRKGVRVFGRSDATIVDRLLREGV